ncbi:hypothetical protein RhiXN_06356 [Rhizoctonia solani]|uniref:Uncharacterized protein n=1 Tax=Rhizoctonia solani TaxID=456999 RepID=A0A8H8NZ23_9AGAM|nr:uncharacterized protein RhiXN_06356 [Rhizoctonia solani]QRW21367.1 hypothetical protein RhiXN_06356 [Rhizoctonia solani]
MMTVLSFLHRLSRRSPTSVRVAVPGFRARSNSEAGYEHEGDESGDDTWVSLHHSVASLSLVAEEDPDRTVRTGRPTIVRELSRESSRSPSRRPHARPKRRAVRPIQRAHTVLLLLRRIRTGVTMGISFA